MPQPVASQGRKPQMLVPRRAGYGVRAAAVVQAPLSTVADLRKSLGRSAAEPFSAAFLKPADEQTVVGLAAVLQAIAQHDLQQEDFTGWGVIAAPRFLGRSAAAEAITKFETGGAWKASPLFVPHRSLHAVSGTISQALQSKGPNFGAGGGPQAVVEGLLAALGLLSEDLPGLWLVLTRCDPEPAPDKQGISAFPVLCQALALGFQPVSEHWSGLRLRLLRKNTFGASTVTMPAADHAELFPELLHFLEQGAAGSGYGRWACTLPWGDSLELAADADRSPNPNGHCGLSVRGERT